MYFQYCSYCGKKTSGKNFCDHCGNPLSKVNICLRCHASIPIKARSCPFCSHNGSPSKFDNTMKDNSRLNWILTNFRPAILVIFLLSTYSLAQLVIGSVFLFLFPTDFFSDPTSYAFFSLIIMLVSSTLLIAIIMKWIPLSSQKKPLEKTQIPLLFLLLIILILSVSIIEIFVTFIDFGLDLINIAPSQSSPYDDFFITPLNILTFAILVTTVGPIFEELVFRRFTISVMLKQCKSKVLVVCMSALIFSLSHTATNLLESLRYAILHIIATFIIGIVLGIIFLQWGLKYAIIFHSFWNFFSLIIQLLIINDSIKLIDLIILLFIIITVIFTVFSLLLFRNSLSRVISEVTLPRKNDLLLIFANFILIITYDLLIPLILLSGAQNIVTAGLIVLFQFCCFLLGLQLISKDQKMSSNSDSDFLDLNSFYDDISSLE